ncbi:putative uncharacterized protein [Aliivibrio wodanis]|uniref:Uncharacterized protein n=1 Tax=Aliivibrio wodanis TaxID=80852 RepID=A0A090I7G6_9GAMM|nr:putative uncharacterized protein [Aliivibrio wodanis]VVV05860.1 hypothetical protein AW0309160_03343 [Aliivibrio wodanis]
MVNVDTLKIELNELTVYQLRSLQHAISQKLQEKTSIKMKVSNNLLTDEELEMLAEVMSS